MVAFASETTAAQQDVLDIVAKLPAGRLFSEALSTDDRLSLLEALPRLEASNPTATPSTSSRLEGEWSFALVLGPPQGVVQSPTRELALLFYAGGFSPGVFGLAVSDRLPDTLLSVSALSLVVRPAQPRAEVVAQASVAGTAATVRVESTLAVETGTRLLEKWTAVDVNNNRLELPAQLLYQRRLFLTYLSDTLAVIRDEGGGVSILTRKPSAFGAVPAADVPRANGVEVEVVTATPLDAAQ